jgi:antitoxin YefM
VDAKAVAVDGGYEPMSLAEIQYVADEEGNTVAAIVPIELWREIESERETAYLLKSENMKRRLLAAKDRQEGISLDEACEKLGI